MRLNNSSCQVYMALKPGVELDESLGDLLFSSTAPLFRTELLLSRDVTSRTYSFYYPRTRPGSDRSLIVSSTNANYADWAELSRRRLRGEQARSGRNHARRAGEIRSRHPREARPRRGLDAAHVPHYTKHMQGASFGTKFEGLAVSRAIPAAGRAGCSTPAAWASSCRAGWGR